MIEIKENLDWKSSREKSLEKEEKLTPFFDTFNRMKEVLNMNYDL